MILPALREEVALLPGAPLADGQPSWTLHDPVRNQFFQLDWLTFEILRRWTLGGADAIASSIATETTLHPTSDDVVAVSSFLGSNQLLQQPIGQSGRLATQLARVKGSWLQRLLHNYLFFRIPLVKPDRWLDRSLPLANLFYTGTFFSLTVVALLVGLLEIYRDSARFTATLIDTISWQGLAGYALTLVAVKIAHELGHAFTAKRFGCRVPTMGIAFLVLWPVAYTDTNEVWKLTDRHQRLRVAAAGVVTELTIAIWATLAWGLLPEGSLKSAAFMLATTTWIATIAINASPFMRFDGYFLLSDALNMPNLHARAFALARWDLRERLFDLREAPPEHFPPRRRAGLIAFAWGTWIYRLFLFLGIAVLVYHFFIKAVGIFLFAVEIGWFVALPLRKELSEWRARMPYFRHNRRARRSIALAALALVLLALPWPTRIASSALLKPVEQFTVYTPLPAKVEQLPWKEGDEVAANAPLVEFSSPKLAWRERTVAAKVERLRGQASAATVDAEQRAQWQVRQQELSTAEAELEETRREAERLSPRAPFAGRIHYPDPDLAPGRWLAAREPVAVLANETMLRVETWLDEQSIRRVAVGDTARFYADGLEGPFLPLRIAAIDSDATRILPEPQLALPHGGSVVTREKNGQQIPEHAAYRVTLALDAPPDELARQSWRGRVVIAGDWEPPALVFARSALAVLWREAGF